MGVFTPYIKDEWKDSIRSYKYRGRDDSIFYNLFVSPVCNWLVEYFPKTLA
jgi:hypothetical protein